MSSDTPFGIPTNPTGSAKNTFNVYPEKKYDSDVLLYMMGNDGRVIKFIARDDIKKNASDIDLFKIFLPGAYGAGESFPHQILGKPEIAKPNSVCSQSYLYVAFPDEQQTINFVKYIKTKFLRVLVCASKVSQHAMSKVYRFVPLQDFTENSDIDWTQSVGEIDKQLYAKYGLTEEEINFVESMIKPM